MAEANNTSPCSRIGESNGDSSFSKKVQSFPCMRNASYHAQEVYESDQKKEIKRDIPKFSSTNSTDEIIDWLTLVNKVFEHRNVLDDRRVGILAMRFRDKVIAWWRCKK